MIGSNSESGAPGKLRVLQIGSYPAANRGAGCNLLSIHERLQAGGHSSFVLDLTGRRRVKQSGVYFPRGAFELARLLFKLPADVVHLHFGSAFNAGKLALAAVVNQLPAAKTLCTLHLGGHFYPRKGLRGRRWGVTGAVLREFDSLIAIDPEIAAFFGRLGVDSNRVHLITPFPRLRTADAITLSPELESFCRRHTPLLASVCQFEQGCDLPLQFDILSKVRQRYPSAGLIAVGGGSLHFKFMYQRALHAEANHIELPGELSHGSIGEVIRRANVLLAAEDAPDAFATRQALQAATPIASVGGAMTDARPPGVGEVEAGALQVLHSLQIARPRLEEAATPLSDGVDDVIRLYKQLAARPAPAADAPNAAAAYEWPSIGWGL